MGTVGGHKVGTVGGHKVGTVGGHKVGTVGGHKMGTVGGCVVGACAVGAGRQTQGADGVDALCTSITANGMRMLGVPRYSESTAGSMYALLIESSYPMKAAAAALRISSSSQVSRCQYAPSRLALSRSQSSEVSRTKRQYSSHACGF